MSSNQKVREERKYIQRKLENSIRAQEKKKNLIINKPV